MKGSDGSLNAFGFEPNMEQTAYQDAMRNWLSVAIFQYPNILVANKFPRKVYFYHFDEHSLYLGPTLGLPYHGQCALFVYQNGNIDYLTAAKTIAESMGKVGLRSLVIIRCLGRSIRWARDS